MPNTAVQPPSIYAIGDVTDRMNLTPVATAEGTALANNLYNNQSRRVDYRDIPTCIFSQPNLGTVGLTEEQARQQYANVEIYKSSFTNLKHTLTGNCEKTLMKIIVDKDTDRVPGRTHGRRRRRRDNPGHRHCSQGRRHQGDV